MALYLLSAFLVAAGIFNTIAVVLALIIQSDFRAYVWFCEKFREERHRIFHKVIVEFRHYRFTDYTMHFLVIAFCAFMVYYMNK